MHAAAFTQKPVFKYLDVRPFGPLGGRGGAVRLYMLAHKIEFEEQLVDFATWGGGEKERVKAELNPLGHLPVTTVNGRGRPESIATLRYVATKIGQYGTDAEADWDSDAAADAHQEWRNAWVTTLGEDETSDKVKTYRQTRGDWYAAFEWYYSRRTSTDSPYLSPGGQPGFADAALFNMMRDDFVLHGEVDLEPFPAFKAAMVAFGELPEVRAWVREWKAREV